MTNKIKLVFNELSEHLPYTIFTVALGMVLLGAFTFISQVSSSGDISLPSRSLFHIFHPIHLLFSATATTAMFLRYEKGPAKAILVGVIGSLSICGLSDIFIPFLAGILLNVKMTLHICIVENPTLIVPFVAVGIFAGFAVPDKTQKGTIFSHTLHVFVSSMASMLYLIAFGLTGWIRVAGMVFIYMVLAVIIPCCMSDIIFPLLLAKQKNKEE